MLFRFFGEAFLRYTPDTAAIGLELPGGGNYKHYTVVPQEIDCESIPNENVCALQAFSIPALFDNFDNS